MQLVVGSRPLCVFVLASARQHFVPLCSLRSRGGLCETYGFHLDDLAALEGLCMVTFGVPL